MISGLTMTSPFRAFAAIFWWTAIMAVLTAVALMLAARNGQVPPESPASFALEQCYPRAGDWPQHGDDCHEVRSKQREPE